MLSIKFIRENKEIVKKAIHTKGIDLSLDFLLKLDEKRLKLLKKKEELRKQRNDNTIFIKELQDSQKKLQEYIKEGKNIKANLKKVEEQYRKTNKEFQNLMLLVPNIPSEDTPIGKDVYDNKEVYRWGKIPQFDFPIKNHIKLGEELNLIDFETGVKVSGFRGYYLKNEAVLLHLALLWFAFNKLVRKGFSPFLPPTLVKEFALTGSGHFPTGKEDIYQITNPGKLASGENITEPIFLVGTSEPSLLAYYSDRLLYEKDLPIKIVGVSQCYRSEVGSYGKDTKGLFRVHEFIKVEQIVICRNNIEESGWWLEALRANSEEILQDLELPYRVISICTREMGAGKFKMYDIETWMPSRNSYSETHSDSNLTQWQARRLNIRYKKGGNGKIEYVNTLNNTAIASPRILISILECNQQKDGSVKIPKVLRPYLNNLKYINPRKKGS